MEWRKKGAPAAKSESRHFLPQGGIAQKRGGLHLPLALAASATSVQAYRRAKQTCCGSTVLRTVRSSRLVKRT